ARSSSWASPVVHTMLSALRPLLSSLGASQGDALRRNYNIVHARGASPARRQQREQILAVTALLEARARAREVLVAEPALPPGDLLGTADAQALALLERADEHRGVHERGVGAGVEPGVAAPQELDAERAAREVGSIDVGDLELAAFRWGYA